MICLRLFSTNFLMFMKREVEQQDQSKKQSESVQEKEEKLVLKVFETLVEEERALEILKELHQVRISSTGKVTSRVTSNHVFLQCSGSWSSLKKAIDAFKCMAMQHTSAGGLSLYRLATLISLILYRGKSSNRNADQYETDKYGDSGSFFWRTEKQLCFK